MDGCRLPLGQRQTLRLFTEPVVIDTDWVGCSTANILLAWLYTDYRLFQIVLNTKNFNCLIECKKTLKLVHHPERYQLLGEQNPDATTKMLKDNGTK